MKNRKDIHDIIQQRRSSKYGSEMLESNLNLSLRV